MPLSDVPSSGRFAGFYVLKVQIDVLTCTAGGTMQQMYKNATYARKVTVQNLTGTASTLVTITSEQGSSNGINGTATLGALANAGSAEDVGGGSITFGDTADPKALIDCSKLFWTATNNGDEIAVILEIPGERLF